MNRKLGMMIRRITAFLLAAFVLGGMIPSAYAAVPETTAQSVCLMDAQSGEIIYEKNAYEEMPMASVTKVMSALVILENSDLEGNLIAKKDVIDSVDLHSTRVGFEYEEEISREALMYAMLVYSANDAANLLAADVGGSIDNFVDMMNDKAEELGCKHTHFMNPNGLDMDGHYTCAHDMALITKAANEYPDFKKYSGASSYKLPTDNVIGENWTLYTKVDMFLENSETYDPRIYAAKTGWTTNAHNTFTACANTEGGSQVIVTLLHCQVKKDMFLETSALVDFAEQFQIVTIPEEDLKDAAQTAAEEAGLRVDTNELKACPIRLPREMSVSDVVYSCEENEGKAELIISVTPEKKLSYQEETGLDDVELYRIPLTVQEVIPTAPVSEAELGDKETGEEAESASVTKLRHINNTLESLPPFLRDIVLVAGIVVTAIILMFVLLFLLGLYRQIRNRRARRRRRQRMRRRAQQRRRRY